MNNIIDFLNTHYDNALTLVRAFEMTKTVEWNPQIYLNELSVQLGHVYNVLNFNESSSEVGRKIDNLGDELADVLLQLINLAYVLNIDMHDISKLEDYKSTNGLYDFSILLGQLTEVIMEEYECRFKKDRVGFNTSYDFEKDRLFKLFIITFQIAEEYKLNMIKEFDMMLKDANGFLEKFKNGERKAKEYIDFYDSKENLLGYCEKEKAHELGYWHKVFGCLIINAKTNKVYFQLKDPNHNKINDKELLEITAGGHLISGETLKNGVREIKEETGLGIDYDKLVFLIRRKVNKKIKKNYIVKEFQYFYSVNLNIKLTDFKNYDNEEVLGFYELNIKDTIKLLTGKKTIIKGKKLINGKVSKENVTLNNFDSAFIEDGLYLDLLNRVVMNNNSIKLNLIFNKLYRVIAKEKLFNPNKFYFDNGRVCKSVEYNKDNIKYNVMLVNTDKKASNYLVYILAIKNGNSVPHLLLKEFNSKRGIEKYFKKLCDIVENNTNLEIISMSYKN